MDSRKYGLRAVFCSLVLFSLSLLVACDPPPPPLVIEPKINIQTRVIDAGSRSAQTTTTIDNPVCLKPSQETGLRPKCQFSLTFASSTTFLAGLTPGNLLVSEPSVSAPNGYLIKVSSVQVQGAGLIVKGEEAQIGDAIDQGEASFEKNLGINDLKSAEALRPSVRFGNRDNAFNISFDEVMFDQDGNPSTTDDQVRVKGTLNFASYDGFSAGIKWKKVLGVPIYPKGVYFRAALGFKESASITVSAKLEQTIDNSVALAKYTFSPITVWVGPVPLVFIPTIRVVVNAKGQASAALEYSATETFAAVAGVEYNNGFHNLSELTPLDQIFSQSVGVAGAATKLRGGLEANAEVLLYGLVGPYAKLSGYLDFDALIPRNPFWKLNGGIAASVGLHVDLVFKTLDYDAELFDQSFKIAESENQAPALKILSPANGIKVQLNQMVFGGLCAEAKDLEDGDLPRQVTGAMTATIPKGTNCVGISSSVVSSLGDKTFYVSATDSQGKSASASTTISVENSPPNAFIVKPKGGDVIYSGQKVLLQGYSIDGNETIDCTTANKPGGPKLKFSSGSAGDTIPADVCQNPVAVFNGTFSRLLTLTATDTQGAVSSTNFNIAPWAVPSNYPPDAAILEPEVKDPDNPPAFTGINTTIELVGRVADQDTNTLTYRWWYKVTPDAAAVQLTAPTSVTGASGAAGVIVHGFFNTNVLPTKCGGLSGTNFVILLEVSDGVNTVKVERTYRTIPGVC
jgi:hypothetical protein